MGSLWIHSQAGLDRLTLNGSDLNRSTISSGDGLEIGCAAFRQPQPVVALRTGW